MSVYDQPLREQDVARDPFSQFAAWFAQAGDAGVRMPEAAALATASADAAPSVRMVLIKDFGEGGFVFFTNYDSQKARELTANPHAAILFNWDPLGRQVRITGPVERVSGATSAEYVRSRPRGSQLSALASPQSHTIADREVLERRVAELERQYGDGELALPDGWGGFRLALVTAEFWQQRHDRLHDRLRYRRDVAAEGSWLLERLAP